MNHMQKYFIIAAALAVCSGIAAADEAGFYTYGAVGKTTAKLNKDSIDTTYEHAHGVIAVDSAVSARPPVYQVQLGYQFDANSAVELGYGIAKKTTYTLSGPTSARENEHVKLVDLVYAATLPIGSGFALTGRAGVAYVQSRGEGSIGNFDGHAARITGGLGVKYNFDKNWSIRSDWNGYTAPSAAKLTGGGNAFTVGLGYKF